jgi:ribonuclease III
VWVRGAAHRQTFEMECLVPDTGLRTTGSGTSRQRAEQQAALAMLEKLENT